MKVTMTGYKRAVLDTLDRKGCREAHQLNGHTSHVTRALREMEHLGLVAGNASGRFWLTREGRAEMDKSWPT